MPTPTAVIRYPQRQTAQFAAHVAQATEPAVLSGGVRHWRASTRWSPETLSLLLRNVRVRAKYSACGLHPDFEADTLGQMFKTIQTDFPSLLDKMTSGPVEDRKRYFFTGDEQFLLKVQQGERVLNSDLEALWPDVALPPFFPEQSLRSVWAWFSAAGVRTRLHYDNNACHNLNAQVCGRKRGHFFPPDSGRRLGLYPIGGANPAVNCSPLLPDSAELGQLPRWEATLERGDLLFLPVYWCHCFEHLGPFNSNVNFWWNAEEIADSFISRRERSILASDL